VEVTLNIEDNSSNSPDSAELSNSNKSDALRSNNSESGNKPDTGIDPEIEGSDADTDSDSELFTNADADYDYNYNQGKYRLVMNEPDSEEEGLEIESLSDDGQFLPESAELREAELELYKLEMERKNAIKIIAGNITEEKNIPYEEAEKEAANLLSTSDIDDAKEKVANLLKKANEAADNYYKDKEIKDASESNIDEAANSDEEDNKISTEPSDSKKIEETEQNKSSDKESKGKSKEKEKDNNNSIENNESEYSATATREDEKNKNHDDPDESCTEEMLSALKESKKESSINEKIGESSSNF